MSGELRIRPVTGLAEVSEGHEVGALIATLAAGDGEPPRSGEVVVVSQKVVSKAEGRTVALSLVEPRSEAEQLARKVSRDPRLVELILSESRRVVRAEPGVLIVETHHGWVCANAGIDASNVPGEDTVTLLPEDPDASARRIRSEIRESCGESPGVVVADSFGRPWRLGQTDVAIGCAGLVALLRGRTDREARPLAVTAPAIADEAAAAADLVRDKDTGVPAAIITGLARHCTDEDGPGAAVLRRAAADDLFR